MKKKCFVFAAIFLTMSTSFAQSLMKDLSKADELHCFATEVDPLFIGFTLTNLNSKNPGITFSNGGSDDIKIISRTANTIVYTRVREGAYPIATITVDGSRKVPTDVGSKVEVFTASVHNLVKHRHVQEYKNRAYCATTR